MQNREWKVTGESGEKKLYFLRGLKGQLFKMVFRFSGIFNKKANTMDRVGLL
jgi:hypothetical protein